ncbi:MAG: ATP phosphoribosyltransferase regulatory subunit [Rhodobacteraceae bacterium]|nr:MAG: ATP phosphoribosyltransferase regulatory subunit [Paracoccaceae bacterium]
MTVDRAYLAGGRIGEARAALAALNARIMALFEAAGAMRVEPTALHAADALLDVYGEDLRGRAFTVEEPDGRELFLRPDFTVPVLQLHLAARAAPARYAYLGPVWRRQAAGSARPTEYLQAGIEVYGEDPAEADADVFALTLRALTEGGVPAPEIVTGDLGLIIALLDAVPMAQARRAALRRHFWRPRRFHALLERYAAAPLAPTPVRAALLAASAEPARVAAMAEAAGALVGARGVEEIAARAAALAADAAEPPLAREHAALLDAALAVEAPAADAHAALADMAAAGGCAIGPALDRFARRLDALTARGVDAARLPFRAATARNLEYYDGFVFEMTAPDRPDLPPLAGGGRYDGIATALGAAAPEPAVGAIVRPEALMAATC